MENKQENDMLSSIKLAKTKTAIPKDITYYDDNI